MDLDPAKYYNRCPFTLISTNVNLLIFREIDQTTIDVPLLLVNGNISLNGSAVLSLSQSSELQISGILLFAEFSDYSQC